MRSRYATRASSAWSIFRVRRAVHAAAALSLLLAAAPAAGQNGFVKGVVTDVRDKRPVDDALVTLVRTIDGVMLGRDTTASDGVFQFEAPPGDYLVTVRDDDYGPGQQSILIVAGDTSHVAFQLIRPDQLFSSMHFEALEPNYFLFGPDGPSSEPGYHRQVKFRIAVRYALVGFAHLEGQTGLYAAYTQDSFWHLYNESSPFYDNNYSPEGIAYLDARDWAGKELSRWVPSVRAFFRHQSNGRDGLDSRSWNRLGMGLEWGNAANKIQHFSVQVWAITSDAPENRDIQQTNGSGEVRLDLAPFIRNGWGLDRFGISVRSRIFGTQVFENFELNGYLRFPYVPGWFEVPPSLMVQGFCGRGEVLLDHRADRCAVRAGIAIIR